MLRKNTLYTLLVVSLFVVTSCAKVSIKDGMQAYDELRYKDAITHLENGLSKVDDVEARKALADAYMRTNRFNEAADTYSILSSDPSINDNDRIAYGRALMATGENAEAESLFDAILADSPGNEEAQALRSSCRKMEEFKVDSARFTVKSISIPDLSATYAPYIDGNRVFFSGEKAGAGEADQYTGLKYTDLYKATLGETSFDQVTKVDGVNDRYHDGAAVLTKDKRSMILTRSNYERKGRLKGNEADVSTTQLYSSVLEEDGGWSTPERLSFCEDKFMYAHPALSSDGNTLYFSSDMGGGFGGMDLYKSTKVNGEWSQPVNLGSTINTSGNEVFPSLRSNDSLYFSSNAHQTLGGLDLMYAVDQGGSWTGPFHLSYPLNSAADDFGIAFLPDNDKGLFSSDRSGVDQIYTYTEQEINFALKGLVTTQTTGEPIENAKIIITNLTDGTEQELMSDDVGMFELDLLPGKDYRVRAEKEGFFSVNEEVSTKNKNSSEDINLNLPLLPLSNPDDTAQNGDGNGDGDGNSKVDALPKGVDGNNPYQIPNILWDYNKWNIREDAKPYLDYVAKLLKDNPDLKVEISSHCDSRGSNFFNERLSEKRAKAASNYLVSKGVRRSMLISTGYGEEKLLNRCSDDVECTEDEHQVNRRTEFTVLNQ